MSGGSRSAVPFIGFISERELREREERRAGSVSGGESALSLAAGTPPIAPQPQHGLSWAEVWQQGAGDDEAGVGLQGRRPAPDPQTVFAVPVRHAMGSSPAHAVLPSSATAALPQQPSAGTLAGRAATRPAATSSPKKDGPPSPSKHDWDEVPRSPGLVARDSLRVPDSPGTPNRRLRAASASLPHLPSLPGPAAAGSEGHSLSGMHATHRAERPSLHAGAASVDDLGRCGVGLLCEKERGSPAAVVREVSSRGSAAREGSIRPGDLVLSVDGANISLWNTATLRNALQGEQGTYVTLEISRSMAEGDDERGPDEAGRALEEAELAITTVKLLRGSPMFWYWHDKHQVLAEQTASLTAQLAQAQTQVEQVQRQLSDARRAAADQEGSFQQQLAQYREEALSAQREMNQAREASERERADMRERYEAQIRKLSTEVSTKQAQVEQSMTRAKDELRASAVSSRQYQQQVAECEHKMLAKANEFERALAQQSQEQAEALRRASAQHQRLLDDALNQAALEHDAAMAQRVAAHAALLQQVKSEAEAAQVAHDHEVERLRADLVSRVRMCAVLDSDKALAEAEVEAVKRQLTEANNTLKAERAERERRDADAEALHARCIQALRNEMQRAGSSFAAEREALTAELAKQHDELERAQKAALSAAAQSRAAAMQARLADQEKEELEAMLLQQAKTTDVAAAKKLAQEELEARVRALVEEVRRGGEARVAAVEAATQSSILKLQRDFEGLAAQRAPAVAGGVLASGLVDERRQREQVEQERDALRRERDALKAERERLLALPNPCGVGIKLAVAAGSAADGDGGAAAAAGGPGSHTSHQEGWLVVDELVPGMAAVNSGAIQQRDRIVAIDGEDFRGAAPAQGEQSQVLQRASKMLLGKRGSTVKLVVTRPGSAAHAACLLEVTLKRGAWGAEHAVLEAERKDMLDLGRWPTPTC